MPKLNHAGNTSLGSEFLEDAIAIELSLEIKFCYQKRRQRGRKIYSLQAPETECISNGKAKPPYEINCKVSITTTNDRASGGIFMLHGRTFLGNPYDGHTRKTFIEELTEWVGAEPERTYFDKGYRGHEEPRPLRALGMRQKRGVHGDIIRELRRRSVVEPIVGHVKNEHRTGENYFKGKEGDCINTNIVVTEDNFERAAAWLRAFSSSILGAVLSLIGVLIALPGSEPAPAIVRTA